MSVYSGFATRKQEAFYNKLIVKCINLLTQKIISQVPYSDIGQFISGGQSMSVNISRAMNDAEEHTYQQSLDGALADLGM